MHEKQIPLPSGRKSAFAARNRESLIRAAQESIAVNGAEFTIEDVADRAGMAVSTVYKHFSNRDQLFNVAVLSAMSDWETWALNIASTEDDPLAGLVLPMRLLVKMNLTHPVYSQIALRSTKEYASLLPQLAATLSAHINDLAELKLIDVGDLESRVTNLVACLTSAFETATRDGDLSSALKQIETSLNLIGISPDLAGKLMNRPLPEISGVPAS